MEEVANLQAALNSTTPNDASILVSAGGGAGSGGAALAGYMKEQLGKMNAAKVQYTRGKFNVGVMVMLTRPIRGTGSLLTIMGGRC